MSAPGDDAARRAAEPAPAPAQAGAPEAWAADAVAPISLMEAISVARAAAAEFTGLPLDGIAASGADPAGGWRVTVEVIEGAARMGENDLLAAYDVRLAADGALTGFERIRRYRREDREIGQ